MGRLHLLHHKSWHVYNRNNVERVKRDEALAALEAESQSQQSLAADSEARLTLLRDRARREKDKGKRKKESDGERALKKQLEGKGKGREDEEEVRATIIRPEGVRRKDGEDEEDEAGPSRGKEEEQPISSADGHVNFWAAQESGLVAANARQGNASYARDKKRQDDRWEDQITMYLGKPAKELRPWYSDKELKSGEERKRTDEQRLELAYKDGESKRLTDPLAVMNGFLAQRDAVLASQAGRRDGRNSRKGADGRPRSPSPESFRPSMLSNRRRRRAASRSPTPPPRPAGPSEKKEEEEEGDRDDEGFAPPLPPHLRSTSTTVVAVKPKEDGVKKMRVDASAERQRAERLLADEAAKKKRQRREWDETPRSTGTGMADDSVYGDAYNRDALREARDARRRWRGGGEDGARFRRDRSRERERYWQRQDPSAGRR